MESGHFDYSILAFPSTPPKIPDFAQLPNSSLFKRPIRTADHSLTDNRLGSFHPVRNGKNVIT